MLGPPVGAFIFLLYPHTNRLELREMNKEDCRLKPRLIDKT